VTARRAIGAVVVVGLLAVLAAVWAIPTFAGTAFVSLRTVVVALPDASNRSLAVTLPDGTPAASGRLRIDVEVTNRYPLPVLVTFRGPAFHAALRSTATSGAAPTWQTTAGDPELEQVDDSPAGGGGDSAVTVDPGTRRVSLTGDEPSIDLSAAAIPPGTYTLSVSAYGISAPAAPVAIVAATN